MTVISISLVILSSILYLSLNNNRGVNNGNKNNYAANTIIRSQDVITISGARAMLDWSSAGTINTRSNQYGEERMSNTVRVRKEWAISDKDNT